MAMQDLKYDAFISYRHTELDQFVAQTLHRELEKFRLPKQLVKEYKMEKKKVERVFRDREELTLVNDLKNPLYNALVNSEYLLVICTPRLKDSEWCKREIDTFTELHGKERILLVLAEGEPDESFPEQLRFEEVEEKDEDGNIRMVRREVEPLAADVRGKNKGAIRRRIKAEVIRILAAMFHVNYDEIKQRHKEQKVKKTATLSLLFSGIFLCVGAYSISTALQLRSQSKQIEEQNKEIMGLVEELDEQYNQVQLSYAKALSESAKTLLANGNRMEALFMARSILHKDGEEGINIPEARSVLSNSLYVYNDGSYYVPIKSYTFDSQVKDFRISNDYTEMIVEDKFGRFFIYNLVTSELIYQSVISDQNGFGFAGNLIYYSTDGGLYQYNINTNINTLIEQDAKFLKCSSDGKYYAYMKQSDDRKLTLYFAGTKDDKVISSHEVTELTSYFLKPEGGFSRDGRAFLFMSEDVEDVKVLLIDVATGNAVASKSLPFDNYAGIYSVSCSNDSFFVRYTQLNLDGSFGSTSDIFCYDGLTLEDRWQDTKDVFFNDIKSFEWNGREYLTAISYNQIHVYDAKDGSLLLMSEFEGGIVQNFSVLDSGHLVGFTRDGQMYGLPLSGGERQDISYFFDESPNSCENFSIVKGGIYILPARSRDVVCYELKAGRRQEILVEGQNGDYGNVYNSNGTLFYNVKDGKLSMYESETQKELYTVPIAARYDLNVSFVGNGEDYFVTWKDSTTEKQEWTVYSSKDGAKVERYFVQEQGYFSSSPINGNKTLILCHFSDYDSNTKKYMVKECAYDILTGKLIGETPFEYDLEECYAVTSDDGSTYACVDKTAEMVSLYHRGEEKPYITKVIPGLSSGSCSLSPDGKFFSSSDCMNKIIIFNTEGMNRVSEFEGEVNVTRIGFGKIDELGIYWIKGVGSTYFMDENGYEIGRMENFLGYDGNRKLMIQGMSNVIYGYPFYTVDMLIDEADEVLKDYELPEEIKEKYGLDKAE